MFMEQAAQNPFSVNWQRPVMASVLRSLRERIVLHVFLPQAKELWDRERVAALKAGHGQHEHQLQNRIASKVLN